MFGKVFRSLWQGSLYGKSAPQLVFLYMIANCDAEGFVDVIQGVMAAQTGLAEDEVRAACLFLEAEDPSSRTTTSEGRRIERIDAHRDWGWKIVNYEKYRAIRDAEERRRQYRESKARTRALRDVDSPQCPPKSTQAEVEAEALESKDLSADADLFPDSSASPKPKKPRGPRSLVGVPETERFVEFYERIWPRRTKRAFASVAWHAALRRNPAWTEDSMCDRAADWANHYADKKTEIQFVPHPSTFLSSGQFLDPPPPVNGVAT